MKTDGSGRYSFPGVFSQKPALSLAVFEQFFYFADEKGLWQAPQKSPQQRKLIWKDSLSLISVYHELQQPQGSVCVISLYCIQKGKITLKKKSGFHLGSSPCRGAQCDICLLTTSTSEGFTCTCPNSKVLLPLGNCECRFTVSH